MQVGIDFGTTNSSAAQFDGQQNRFFRLDPSNKDERLLPSLIYITKAQEAVVGFAAAQRYIAEGIGRPIRYEKRFVGEIEIMVAGTGGAPIVYQQPIYAYEDVEAPGRLLQSIKTALRQETYQGTHIFKRYYTVQDLIAILLRRIKQQVETQLGRDVPNVVLGRPVLFSEDAAIDAAAQAALEEAARLAGFSNISFELEPIAVAYLYHRQATQRQMALVFDFGGGTLDFAIVEVGGTPPPRVIASHGLLLGGDDIDRRIVTALEKHFGAETTYRPGLGGSERPFPRHITQRIQDWQTLLELAQPEQEQVLQQAIQTGSAPGKIRALWSLVHNNLGFALWQEAERVKIELSDRLFSAFQMQAQDIRIRESFTRARLEGQLRATVAQINAGLDTLLARAGIGDDRIDVVVRTGGSALIPLYQRLLEERFGRHKVVAQDAFSSIVAGLSVAAWERYG